MKIIVTLAALASSLGLVPVKKTLSNGKEVSSIEYEPGHLPQLFKLVESEVAGLGRDGCAVLDGPCPFWMLPCLAHGAHPAAAAVRYPQGGPDAVVPVSGFDASGAGSAEGIEFVVEEAETFTKVTFRLTAASIDLPKALATLVAPAIPQGKPVRISGRGPIAIAAALGSAYAHRVAEVAFDRGDGKAFVVSISHGGRPLGTVIEA